MSWILDPKHRVPVRTWSELQRLNSDQIMAGYRAARNGLGCPIYYSRAFWHGWRNGRVDFQGIDPDEAQRSLTGQRVKFIEGMESLAELTEQARRAN